MKKWNKPQLFSLGVENTFTELDECTCDATTYASSKNQHFCHSDNQYHENGCKKTQGHYRNDKCDEVHWASSHDSKCCCASRVYTS